MTKGHLLLETHVDLVLRRKPAAASTSASYWPVSSFRRRVSRLPRMARKLAPGNNLVSCALRRTLLSEVPKLAIDKVGIKAIRHPIQIKERSGRVQHTVATFNMYVGLPHQFKGTHMSRNLEALADILDEEVATEAPSLENLCRRLAVRLLDKHDYASHAQAKAEADYFLTRTNPGGKPSVEAYRLLAEAEAFRSAHGKPTTARRVGVQVVGMSACPCAMETVRHKLGAKVPKDLPFITMMLQREIDTDLFGLDLGRLQPRGGDVQVAHRLLVGHRAGLLELAHDRPAHPERIQTQVPQRGHPGGGPWTAPATRGARSPRWPGPRAGPEPIAGRPRSPARRKPRRRSRRGSPCSPASRSGWSKSGSPAPKPITFSPAAFNSFALASTASVGDSAIPSTLADARF